MKHWIAMLLTITMVLSLAACGSPAATNPMPPAESPVEDNDTPAPNTGDESLPPDVSTPGTEDQKGREDDGTASPAPSPTGSAVLPSNTAPSTPTDSQEPSTQTPPAASAGAVTPSAVPSPVPSVVTVPPASETPTPEESPKILIAYFTWADNTVVEDADAALESALQHYGSVGDSASADDVDAVTSASILAPGNAARIAGWIQQEVGGDLHSIVVEDLYPSNYDDCLDRAADEKAENARPALSTHVDNMEDYDVVFLGFPNWWYTLPMPILTFVEEYDFSGKTVVPFVTHGTGGLSATIRDLTAALPDDVTVLDEIGVYRSEVNSSQSAVQTWAAGLDLER